MFDDDDSWLILAYESSIVDEVRWTFDEHSLIRGGWKPQYWALVVSVELINIIMEVDGGA